jgi:hypothetical protein
LSFYTFLWKSAGEAGTQFEGETMAFATTAIETAKLSLDELNKQIAAAERSIGRATTIGTRKLLVAQLW